MADNQNKSLDDIVFEYRNKEYGAFRLRSSEKGYLTKAFFIGAVIFVLFVIALYYYNVSQVGKKELGKAVNAEIIELNQPEELPDEEEEVYQQKQQETRPETEQAEIAQIKAIMPEPKKNVKKEETIPTAKEAENKNLGPKNADGAPTDSQNTANSGPENNAPSGPTTPVDPPKLSNDPYTVVDVEASFTGKGGITIFLRRNLEYTDRALDKGTQGRVIVKFIVERDGSISNITIAGKKIGDGLDEEAMRVIKRTSKMWTPGKVNNQPVRSYFRVPITFMLPPE